MAKRRKGKKGRGSSGVAYDSDDERAYEKEHVPDPKSSEFYNDAVDNFHTNRDKISKNKGLTAKRKKENWNPRVKHKRKFRKALIRRKGQVRKVRTEMERYSGEMFGIRAGVVASWKLKG